MRIVSADGWLENQSTEARTLDLDHEADSKFLTLLESVPDAMVIAEQVRILRSGSG